MKKNGADFASLAPAADGWSLRHGEAASQNFPSLAEAAAALPATVAVHLALPCQALVVEGLRLPATHRDELTGMVRLQLEKNLPYSLEEVSSDFVIVESGEKESALISLAAPHGPLEVLCQPLREAGRLPEMITPFVLHVATACPPGETVFVVYPEQGHLVLAICADGRLCWAHVVAGIEPARLAAELPQALLAATMEGAPTTFSRVLLAEECLALAPVLRTTFPLPIETLPAAAPKLAAPMNLVPPSWRSAAQRQQRARQMRGQLRVAAVLYVLAVIAAVVWLVVLQRRADALRAQFETVRPQLELIQKQQARSNALAPAFETSRFTVELIYQLQRVLPDPAVDITEFDQQPGQWRVTGEAPNPDMAVDYVTRLKADPELAAYQINASPPQLLPNEHAQFSIFGTR